MDNEGKKIGILGGTFNPIHIGHLLIAQNALEFCKLDKVLIMPAGVSYFKNQDEIISTEHRINLVNLSIENNCDFELSTIETDRPGNSYTFETLEQLSSEYPNNNYYYICGADTLFNIEKWKNPSTIFSKATICCAMRNSLSFDVLSQKADELVQLYGGRVLIMPFEEVEISSTKIRKMFSNGYSCKYYMNDRAIEYIKHNKLYS